MCFARVGAGDALDPMECRHNLNAAQTRRILDLAYPSDREHHA
jgi:hypothetical protein